MKQDPLEQAAKEYAEMHLDVSGNLGKYLVKAVFQDGAKWHINLKINKMYNRIFKTLENRFKEYESLEKYLDSHIDELQTKNDSLKEIINILKAELEYAQSQLNQGLND